MAFTTVTGSNGVTSLVGTTGIDVATIVTLQENVFVGGNTGGDTLTVGPLALTSGNNVASAYNVRMGGGNDTTTLNSALVASYISLDGETLANDGNDVFTSGANAIINSEIVGRGGNDVFGTVAIAPVLDTGLILNGSTVNGNTGNDTIIVGASTGSFVYGGADTDTISTVGNSAGVLINGNKGSDTINLSSNSAGTIAYAGAFTSGSVYGGNGNDTISALNVTNAAGAPIGNTAAGVFLSGDLGDDNVTGSGAVDTINGGDGADTLAGAAGADTINGDAGNDIITGGTQGDVISTGTGADIVRYAVGDSVVAAGASTGFDTITDFTANTTPVGLASTADQIGVGPLPVAFVAAAGNFASGGASLSADLGLAALGVLGVNGVSTVTITGAVAWAGNYIVIGANAGGYDAADTVIKVNSLNNITAANIANVIGNF